MRSTRLFPAHLPARAGAFLCLLALLIGARAAAMPRAFPKRVGGPAVTFETGRVGVDGATPGAAIYFAGVSLYTGDGVLRVVKAGGMATADATGHAEFATDIHQRSVWLVVDPAKGYTAAAPFGMLLREMDMPGEGNENAGQLRRLLLRRFSVDAFLIRPGQGVWTAYYRDGGPLDEDGEPDGQNNANLADLQPAAGTTGEAERFKPGDYLFLVDRNSLEFHVARRGAE